mmetsp:Transcript_28665/g.92284  ORF Transcript_28665/g.92284 Transcript_28665/m.92284 type:complete len:204 (+) Transcript_28665:917-1528(+)
MMILLLREDEAHGDAGDVPDGDAGVHHGEGAAADGGHRRRAAGLGDEGFDADRVVEVGHRGHRGFEGPLREGAVAHLPPAGGPDAPRFPDARRREGVLEVKAALVGVVVEGVQILQGHALAAQRARRQGLGLPPRKDRRPVGRRQGRAVDGDGPHLVRRPAVAPTAFAADPSHHRLLAQLLQHPLRIRLGIRRKRIALWLCPH